MNTHEKLNRIIILYDQGCSITKLKNMFHISDTTISKHLKENNRIVKNKEYYNNLLEQAITYYKNNKISLEKLSNIYKIDRHTLSNYFKHKNIEVINSQNLLRINETIFDEIDNEEKAYWLGFIYADGYISSPYKNKKQFKFELTSSIKDKDHIIKFAKFISYENKILIDDYRCRIVFSNKHIWNILNNYGCTPRKSLTLKFPDECIFKSKDLIIHFIRGYIDGDGCLSWTDKNHKKPRIQILGTSDFLNSIQKYLNNNHINKLQNNNGEKECLTKILCYSGGTAKKISNVLYSNSKIYLDRKYKRYLFFHDLPC